MTPNSYYVASLKNWMDNSNMYRVVMVPTCMHDSNNIQNGAKTLYGLQKPCGTIKGKQDYQFTFKHAYNVARND